MVNIFVKYTKKLRKILPPGAFLNKIFSYFLCYHNCWVYVTETDANAKKCELGSISRNYFRNFFCSYKNNNNIFFIAGKNSKKPYNLSTRILWLFEQHSFRGSLWRRQSNASIKAFTYCSFPTAEGIKASP